MLLHWFNSSSWNTPIGVGENLHRWRTFCHGRRRLLTYTKQIRNSSGRVFAVPGVGGELEVLAGRDGIDGLATLAVGIGVYQRPHVHDSLTLLA